MRRMTGSSAAVAEQSEPVVHARFPLGWLALLVMILFGGSLLLGLAASGKAFNYHEARYAQGAREMLESGSWLIPTIGKRPRLQKPPIVYWSMAASMAAFGTEKEWPARLPSVVAALTVAILVADLGARLKREREKDPKLGVALQSDKKASFGLVVRVMDVARAAGFEQLPAFIEQENRPAGAP